MSTTAEPVATDGQSTQSVKETKERLTALKQQLSVARKESTQAKRAVTNAEKALKSASDDDKAAAQAKVNELIETRDQAIARVESLDTEIAQAKLDVTAAQEREKTQRAEERAAKPKKAPMTLSQRRAILKLGDGPQTPATEFNKLPYTYLVGVGLAQVEEVEVPIEKTRKVDQEQEIPEVDRKEGGPTTKTVKVEETYTENVRREQFTLTELGEERVKDINPKWKSWKAPSQNGDTTADTGSEAAVVDPAV